MLNTGKISELRLECILSDYALVYCSYWFDFLSPLFYDVDEAGGASEKLRMHLLLWLVTICRPLKLICLLCIHQLLSDRLHSNHTTFSISVCILPFYHSCCKCSIYSCVVDN